MDEFYKVMGVPWGLRKLLLTVNPDMVWTIDSEGETQVGTEPGQKGQLVRRSVHKGSQIGAPEAFPLGEFSPVNPVRHSCCGSNRPCLLLCARAPAIDGCSGACVGGSNKSQRVVTTFENGRLERRTIDEWLPAGSIYSRWQADGHRIVEIGCLGEDQKFYFARVYKRVWYR
eukprot:5859623-Prymnesium_polylepis.1